MTNSIYIAGGRRRDLARNWHLEDLNIYRMFERTHENAVTSSRREAYPKLGSAATSGHEAACASGSISPFSAMRGIAAGYYQLASAPGLENIAVFNPAGSTATCVSYEVGLE